MRRFGEGQYQFLVGCDVFIEGFDMPRISIVAVAKPTKVQSRYVQMVGRGFRTLPGTLEGHDTPLARRQAIARSAKPRLLVLDFVGNSGRHKLISMADILGGKHDLLPQVVAKAKEQGEPIDILDELGKEEAAREERRKVQEARAHYHTKEVDPFGYGHAPQRNGFQRQRQPTEKMIALLQKHQRYRPGMSMKEAAQAIVQLKKEWRGEACSPKQAAVLGRFGEAACNKAKAKALIDLIRLRGWRQRTYRLTKERWSLRHLPEGWVSMIDDPQYGKLRVGGEYRSEQDCRAFISACMENDYDCGDRT